jgi:serine phosphatase RsbU (regulator of sigma subunit)/Flp pilus assembly protein TadD
MKILLSLIITAFFFQTPQNQRVDSINHLLSDASGKEEIYLLNELFKEYRTNDPIKALSYAEQALVLAQYAGDKSGESSSLNNIGVIYRHTGDLDKALSNYIASLHIQEDNKFEDALAYTYSNIGTIYSLKGEPHKALDYFLKANAQFESINHHLRIVGTLNNIGNVYTDLGDYDNALSYYLKSLDEYEQLEDKSQAFVPLTNIGNLFFNKGDMDKALEYYNRSLVLEQASNNLSGQATALHSFGSVFRKLGDHDNAISFFEKSLEMAQEAQDNILLKRIYESLSGTYFTKGDHFLAYSFLQLHNVVKDSLFNEESNRRIAELENNYQFEEQQKEILHLQTDSDLQQLRIKHDDYIIAGIAIILLIVAVLTFFIIKENKEIKRTKKLLEIKNEEITDQKMIIEEKNFNITESINYAKRVQKSILKFNVSEEKQARSFILFKPKDIVSGDFFWYAEKDEVDIFVTADCTGHGVAGAFMTVLGVSLINQIVTQDNVTDPKVILRLLDAKIKEVLTQQGTSSSTHSIDLAICAINQSKNELTYSGANRPLYRFSKSEFYEVKGTKSSIGDSLRDDKDFEDHVIKFEKGDTFYMTSDGYADQFGGERGKKFMTKKFKQLLKDIQPLSLTEQKDKLNSEIEDWMKDTEQTDDIIVTGIQF